MKFIPKNRVIALIPLVFIASIFASYIFGNRNVENLEIVSVERKTVSKEILVSGATETQNSVDLAFEQSGRIQSVYARVGQNVSRGNLLAVIDTSDLVASLHEAEADVDLQEARLGEILIGARAEEIALYESRLKRAEQAYDRAYNSFWNVFRNTYTTSDDFLYRVADGFFSNPRSANPLLNSNLIADQQLAIDLNFYRGKIGSTIISWRSKLDTSLEADEANRIAVNGLNEIILFFDMLSRAVNNAFSHSTLSEGTLSTWRTNIATTRTSLHSSVTELTNSYGQIQASFVDVSIASRELSLAGSPPTSEQIAAQKALVSGSKARAERISAQINKFYIRSPIDGIVTKFDATVGEIAPQGTPLIFLIDPENLVIKAYIPEIDIGEISNNNEVLINFDAFPSETFNGKVSSIEPDAELIDGVPNYRATVSILDSDERLKSGLSANLSIVTAISKDTISVPRFSIVQENASTFVRKVVNGNATLTPVTIGIYGSDGTVEVLSGLAEFDKIALPK